MARRSSADGTNGADRGIKRSRTRQDKGTDAAVSSKDTQKPQAPTKPQSTSGRMNEANAQEKQLERLKALTTTEKAKLSRQKRREKRSFNAQGAAMDRKGIAEQDRVYVVGRHWDPDQQDPHNPEPFTQYSAPKTGKLRVNQAARA